MSATITIELCAEDRARLDHINVNLTELILRVMGSQKIDMGEVLRRAAPELAGKPAEQHPVTEPFLSLIHIFSVANDIPIASSSSNSFSLLSHLLT